MMSWCPPVYYKGGRRPRGRLIWLIKSRPLSIFYVAAVRLHGPGRGGGRPSHGGAAAHRARESDCSALRCLSLSLKSSIVCQRVIIQHTHKQKHGDRAGGEEEEEGEGEHSQVDEEDMGMSYQELGIYGRLRKIERCVGGVGC